MLHGGLSWLCVDEVRIAGVLWRTATPSDEFSRPWPDWGGARKFRSLLPSGLWSLAQREAPPPVAGGLTLDKMMRVRRQVS